MAFDTLIKKFFPGIIAVLVAVIAYFQASGVVELATMSVLAVDPDDMTRGSMMRAPLTSPVAQRTRSARKLYDHNIFDHETDLNAKPEPVLDPSDLLPVPVGTLDLSDPLVAERCEGMLVHIITESDDPTWSIVVLQGPGEDRASLRRVGDKVGDYEVTYIGFNRLEASPSAWLVKDATLCQALLFTDEKANPSARPSPAKAGTAVPPTAPPAATPPRGAPAVPQEIQEKIEKVSGTEFNVDRSVVDHVLENQTELMRSARIVPEKGADGKTVGIRLFGIRPDTLLGTLGLQNGDRIETINGFNMASPEEALNAYARLRTANKLSVKVTRRGKPETIDLNIK
jgi:general secretion pathway protein C